MLELELVRVRARVLAREAVRFDIPCSVGVPYFLYTFDVDSGLHLRAFVGIVPLDCDIGFGLAVLSIEFVRMFAVVDLKMNLRFRCWTGNFRDDGKVDIDIEIG